MAEVHLIVGYMGFGKTTLAKKLAEQLPAVRLTLEDFSGRCSDGICPKSSFACIRKKSAT